MKKIFFASLVIVALFWLAGCQKKSEDAATGKKSSVVNKESVKSKVEKLIAASNWQVKIKDIVQENDLFRVTLEGNGQEIVAYVTGDGNKFFPQYLNIDEMIKNSENKQKEQAQRIENIPKREKPQVDLFVMSYCPYGTQIVKGMIPVLEKLQGKIEFQLRFVDYIMHEKKEIDENLRQYCVQKEYPGKLVSYLSCFLKKGEGTEASCLRQAGIDESRISSCVGKTDSEFKVTEGYKDKSQWKSGHFPPFDVDKELNEKYGVQGSPTLVVNGQAVDSNRDPASLLKTICNGFASRPSDCEASLSSDTPAPGFGEGSSSGSSAGSGCGG